MASFWSSEVRVMVRPFRTYAELAEHDGEPVLARPLRLLLVLGAFVSFTTAGRLVAAHVLWTFVFWSFVPALQALAVAVAIRLCAAGRPMRPAIALYFAGLGPWLLLLSLIAATCLFAPDLYRTMTWLLGTGILPGLFLGAFGWGVLLTFAFFRAGLGLPRWRAIGATSIFYFLYCGSIIGYYLLTNQIQPQIFGVGP